MRRQRKRLLIIMGCCVCLIIILLAAALAPKLLANRDLVKSYIVEKTAQAGGGNLDYERISIGYFPLPHLVATDVRLTQPDTFALQAGKLSIYPRILAMLGGRLSIRRLVLSAPDIHAHLFRNAEQAPTKQKADADGPGGGPAVVDRQIKAVFGMLAAIDPHTQLEINNGLATFHVAGDPDIQITAINAMAERTSAGMIFDLSCKSNLIENVDVQASVDIARSRIAGNISLTAINPDPILLRLSPPPRITLAETKVDANLDFTIDGTDKANCRFQFQAPTVGLLKNGDRTLTLSAATLAGEMAYEQRQLSLRLNTITTDQPALDFTAAAILTSEVETNHATLTLSAEAKQLDIAVINDLTRAVAGDQESIRTAIDMVRAGMLVAPSFTATLNSDQTGWQVDEMKATGRLSGGLVSIAAIHADAENVAGKIVYANDHVDFLGLSGRLAGATFENLDLTMDWANQLTWSMGSPSVDIEAAPFFTWLTDFEALNGLRETLSIIAGRAAVSTLNISGPLTAPDQWAMEIVASPQGLVLNTPQTPFDIKLSGGEIIYRPGNDQSSNVGIEFLDAAFLASHQSSSSDDLQGIDLQVDGSVGSDTLAWLNTRVPFPYDLQITPPVSLTDVRFHWDRGGVISLKGELEIAGGAVISVDITQSHEELEIHELRFADGRSEARIAASRKGPSIDLTFTGKVEKQTIDHLFEVNPILSGNIEGDFKAHINTDSPLTSTVVGKLSGNGLRLPDLVAVPITVDGFSVVGHGNRIDIHPSEVTLDDTRLRVDGTLVPQDRALIFNINIDTDHLDMGLIQALQSNGNEHPPTDGKKSPPAMVPHGAIHFKARSLSYGDFTWSAVDADMRIDADRIYATLNQAHLCGISTIGDIDITPRGIGFDIRPLARKASLQNTSDCLWDKYVRVDARYDLGGNIVMSPTRDNPLTALSGQMTFRSQNGRIYHSSTLLKIFSILNVTELFTGGQSDISKQGYGYSDAYVKTRIDGATIHLDELLLDGNALKITGQGTIDIENATADITVLAAPLKTVDRLVRKIPIIGYITGGSLITVPIRLHGKIKDLSVVPLPPSAVGKGLLHFMERTLKAPFKLVEGAKETISQKSKNKNEGTADVSVPQEP